MNRETIVALATPEGEGGLSVVRISGPRALAVAGQVFSGAGFGDPPQSHRAVLGVLHWPAAVDHDGGEPNAPIDQVLALPMLAPNSYTGEDTVEFSCHGGRLVGRLVVAACRQAGAIPASAGEFTRRAFLNGKLSLDQAEAVADLIHSESEYAARGAIRQLLGGLDSQLASIERPLLDLLARIEGSLEFVDEENVSVPAGEVVEIITLATDGVDALLAMAPAGRLLRDGVQVVLVGPPNVGKSTLFNALVEQDRAIVDGEAGTTRDVVTASIVRDGTVFVFHDTAGLRRDPGRIERMGIARTRGMLENADIVLVLHEVGAAGADTVSGGVDECPAAVVIHVGTKLDLAGDHRPGDGADESVVATSGRDGSGLAELWQRIDTAVGRFRLREAITSGVVLNERHQQKLTRCRDDLRRVLAELEPVADDASEQEAGPGDEVVGTLLAAILSQLGEVSGRIFSEQLLETVFRRFCVGK